MCAHAFSFKKFSNENECIAAVKLTTSQLQMNHQLMYMYALCQHICVYDLKLIFNLHFNTYAMRTFSFDYCMHKIAFFMESIIWIVKIVVVKTIQIDLNFT